MVKTPPQKDKKSVKKHTKKHRITKTHIIDEGDFHGKHEYKHKTVSKKEHLKKQHSKEKSSSKKVTVEDEYSETENGNRSKNRKKLKYPLRKKKHHKSKEMLKEEILIDEGLNAIYGDSQVDFSKMDRSRSWITSLLLTIIVTLSIIAITAWGGFFAYTTYFDAQNTDTFEISIDAPKEASSGELTEVKIHYNNPSDVPLARLSLDVRIPKSFKVSSFNPIPDNQEELIWDIGTLAPNTDGDIIINGIWLANTPSSLPIQVFTNYRPANFNADFQNIETVQITTFESLINTIVEGPEEGRSGELLEYTINVENTSDGIIENIKVSLNSPEGFFFEESIPEIEAGQPPVWVIPAISPGSKEEISFSGTFASDITGFNYFNIDTAMLYAEESLEQGSIEAFTDVINTGLSLKVVVNGANENVTTDLGENVRISIDVENTGESDIDEINLFFNIDSEESIPVDWDEADIQKGYKNGTTISWSPIQIDPLAPGEHHITNLILPILDEIDNDYSDVFSFVASTDLDGIEVKSSPIEVSLNTQADFSAEARYYNDEGAPLGSGVMPPQVGEDTIYQIHWQINNQLHELEDIEVRASLPPNVTWESDAMTDLGTLEYSHANHEVSWKIAVMPTDIEMIEGSFYVGVSPKEDNIGKFIKLLSGSSFRAMDSVTEATIQTATYTLDTELPNDAEAEGKGVVVE